MQCEMCGREADLYLVEIEGAILRVCKECSKYGKVIRKVNLEKPKLIVKEKPKKKEPTLMIVEDYAKIIRDKREKMNLKQEQFAKLLNEKESTIHHIETGKMEPSLKLARKMEKILKIKLIEEVDEDEGFIAKSRKSEGLTIGDLIKIKK